MPAENSSLLRTYPRVLLVAAVDRELSSLAGQLPSRVCEWDSFPLCSGVDVAISGVGRSAAAAAVAWNMARKPYDCVLSVGVCGSLPGSDLQPGDLLLATGSVFHEEGIALPEGFADMQSLGFPLGPFTGNEALPTPALFDLLRNCPGETIRQGAIATVATCSGSDEAASTVRERTGALAEAMEGAAVVSTALRLGAAAAELRAVSNTTGDRDRQKWDFPLATRNLARVIRKLISLDT